MLYDEPELVSHIMQVWHEDGIPADMPMFITEGNLSSAASETYQDIFSGLWLADYIGSFLNSGGNAVYYFHYLPLQMEPGATLLREHLACLPWTRVIRFNSRWRSFS